MQNFYELPEYAAILTLLDSVLAELNLGLLIYRLESEVDPNRLRLIYANAEASRCTGVDLGPRVGKTIVEAFPALADTDVPRTYLEVARGGAAVHLGNVRYRDDEMAEQTYSVRAFPMPLQCVGVLFEQSSATPPTG